ncbi:MAG: hypothetical protein LAP13_11130 [Acidobacteriia bacterium]|nr:hypothetical protein [Terriglobia bacterium]
MGWLLGGVILLGVGLGLRRLLSQAAPSPRARGMVPLSPDREAIYRPVALEAETQAAILGIALNDAFDERDAQHAEMAWRLVQLSAGEWDRLGELVTGLLEVLSKRLATARTVVPARTPGSDLFKSRVVIDHVRLHELLDQLVFSSRRRFQLQIRLLRGAVTTLSAEFRRTYRYGEQTRDCSTEVWTRLDLYFHDLDLVAKQALLALRALMACVPAEAVEVLAGDLRALLQRRTQVSSVSVDE